MADFFNFLMLVLTGYYVSDSSQSNLQREVLARLACNFDNEDLCSWTQDNGTLSWKFGTGTPRDITGPNEPFGGKGQYIYLSSYEGIQSDNQNMARIQSAEVDTLHPLATCLSFYSYIYGSRVEELRVNVVTMVDQKIHRQVTWIKNRTEADMWMPSSVHLDPLTKYRIEIEAKGGCGFEGYIAIDELKGNLGPCGGSCFDHPCKNDGLCIPMDKSWKLYKCVCIPPYIGDNCEKDLCSSNPCQNGGLCRLDGASFLCYCKTPYSGKLCEKKICGDDVCIHGKCEKIGKSHKCRCDEGYTGLRCKDKIETTTENRQFWLIIWRKQED